MKIILFTFHVYAQRHFLFGIKQQIRKPKLFNNNNWTPLSVRTESRLLFVCILFEVFSFIPDLRQSFCYAYSIQNGTFFKYIFIFIIFLHYLMHLKTPKRNRKNQKINSVSGSWWLNPWRDFSFCSLSAAELFESLVHWLYNYNEKKNLFVRFLSEINCNATDFP